MIFSSFPQELFLAGVLELVHFAKFSADWLTVLPCTIEGKALISVFNEVII